MATETTYKYIKALISSDVDQEVIEGSENPVSGGAVQKAIEDLKGTIDSGGSSSSGTTSGDRNFLIAKNEAEITALTIDENYGKVIMYVGNDTEDYKRGSFYLVEIANSLLGTFILGKSKLA